MLIRCVFELIIDHAGIIIVANQTPRFVTGFRDRLVKIDRGHGFDVVRRGGGDSLVRIDRRHSFDVVIAEEKESGRRLKSCGCWGKKIQRCPGKGHLLFKHDSGASMLRDSELCGYAMAGCRRQYFRELMDGTAGGRRGPSDNYCDACIANREHVKNHERGISKARTTNTVFRPVCS